MTIQLENATPWLDDLFLQPYYTLHLKLQIHKLQGRNRVNKWEIKNQMNEMLAQMKLNVDEVHVTSFTDQAIYLECTFKHEIDKIQSLQKLNHQKLIICGNVYGVEETNAARKHPSEEATKKTQTILMSNLPLKWFDVPLASSSDDIEPISSSKFRNAMQIFGEIEAIDISVDGLQFHAYVRFKNIQGAENAMDKLCESKALRCLTYDTSGWLSIDQIRRRRFQREEEIFQKQELKKQLKKNVSIFEQLSIQYDEQIHANGGNHMKLMDENQREGLEKRMQLIQQTIAQGIERFSSTSKMTIIQQKDLLREMEECLEKMKNCLASFESKIKEGEKRRAEEEMQALQSRFQIIKNQSTDRLNEKVCKPFRAILESNPDLCTHVAVIADIRSVEQSIEESQRLLHKSPEITAPGEEHALELESNLKQYATLVQKSLTEVEYDFENAWARIRIVKDLLDSLGRLNAIESVYPYGMKENTTMTIQDKALAFAQRLHGNELWSSSTAELEVEYQNIQEFLNRWQEIQPLIGDIEHCRMERKSSVVDALAREQLEQLEPTWTSLMDLSIPIDEVERDIHLYQDRIETFEAEWAQKQERVARETELRLKDEREKKFKAEMDQWFQSRERSCQRYTQWRAAGTKDVEHSNTKQRIRGIANRWTPYPSSPREHSNVKWIMSCPVHSSILPSLIVGPKTRAKRSKNQSPQDHLEEEKPQIHIPKSNNSSQDKTEEQLRASALESHLRAAALASRSSALKRAASLNSTPRNNNQVSSQS